MDLDDPGFDFSVLSEFRARLGAGGAEERLLETMLTHFKARGLLKAGGRQRTDSTHVLAAIHTLNRLELVGRTLQHALNILAQVTPDWLLTQITPDWFDRYSRPIDEYRSPKGDKERQALAETIGRDGQHLLARIASAAAPCSVRKSHPVQPKALCSFAVIIMNDSSEHIPTAHRAALDSPFRSGRNLLSDALIRSGMVEIRHILLQYAVQVALT